MNISNKSLILLYDGTTIYNKLYYIDEPYYNKYNKLKIYMFESSSPPDLIYDFLINYIITDIANIIFDYSFIIIDDTTVNFINNYKAIKTQQNELYVGIIRYIKSKYNLCLSYREDGIPINLYISTFHNDKACVLYLHPPLLISHDFMKLFTRGDELYNHLKSKIAPYYTKIWGDKSEHCDEMKRIFNNN